MMTAGNLYSQARSAAAERADIAIVGGGSAGCVLASRLSEDSRLRVVLIEAGNDTLPGREPADVRDPFYVAAYNPDHMWPDLRVTWSQDEAGNKRTMWYEQARIMGGGSSVNSMIGLRGHPGDFASWAAVVGPEWSWDRVKPYYRKLERDLNFQNAEHGTDGPIPIRRHAKSDWPPFCKAVERALAQHGVPFVPDANDPDVRDCMSAVPMTNLPSQRVSAAIGYLTPEVRKRKNLRILPNTSARHILFEDNRAVGVSVVTGDNAYDIPAANVVVCAGSLHSPALLMRSGVGNAASLGRLGIPVIADRPGVGENLQDHPVAALAAFLKPGAKQAAEMRSHGNLSLRYSSRIEGCAPQDMYMAISNKTSWHALGLRLAYVAVLLQEPHSRGSVKLVSPDWRDEPEVLMNILSDERDMIRMESGVRYAMKVVGDPAVTSTYHDVFLASFSERVQSYNRPTRFNALRSRLALSALDMAGPLRGPMVRHLVAPRSDAKAILEKPGALRNWLTENVAAYYHVSGTCRLGRVDDRLAVADKSGAVIETQNLYVADNSLMPTIVRSQTNLTAMMIGEKMADTLKARLVGHASA